MSSTFLCENPELENQVVKRTKERYDALNLPKTYMDEVHALLKKRYLGVFKAFATKYK